MRKSVHVLNFDKPATVTWTTPGPGGRPMPANKREFATLREAVLYVSARRSYDAFECEQLEKETKRR